jgi:hypothetical protein
LWQVNPLLGNDHEISNYATTVAMFRPVSEQKNYVFYAVLTEVI